MGSIVIRTAAQLDANVRLGEVGIQAVGYATAAIDALGRSQAASTSALSCRLCRRRRTVLESMVST